MTAPAPEPSRNSARVEGEIASARRFRRRAFLLPLGFLVFGVTAGEIAARVEGSRPASRQTSAGERGWGNAPGEHVVRGAKMTISDEGTRGPLAAAGGILILGDDAALGAGLSDSETLATAAARRSGLPVTLAACEGYGLEQELLWLRELAPRTRPRLAVVALSLDDPGPFAATLFTSLRFSLSRVSALAASLSGAGRRLSRPELSARFKHDGMDFRAFEGTIKSLGKWSRENRIPVLIAVWPLLTKQDEALGEYYERIRAAAQPEGLFVHNLLEDLGEQSIEGLATPEGLPNAEAHRRAGEGIGAYCADLLK
jgi:hypothetical protein